MERILSKEEIAELLTAVREGEIDTGSPPEIAAAEVEAAPIDILQSLGTGRWRIPNFELILDAFARNFGISLTNFLQSSVTVKRTSIQVMEFDAFSQNLEGHGAFGIIRMTPLKSGGLLIANNALSFVLVEILLGGAITSRPLLLKRALTPIEINIIEGIIKDACVDIERAFQQVFKLNATLMNIEINPKMINIVTPNTQVMVTEFDIQIESFPGTLTLVIPCNALEPLREALKEGVSSLSGKQAVSWDSLIAKELNNLEINLTAQSGEVALPIRDILNFKKGDVIFLDYDPNAPIRMLVENRPKFFALSGVHKGKKAIKITGRIGKGD